MGYCSSIRYRRTTSTRQNVFTTGHHDWTNSLNQNSHTSQIGDIRSLMPELMWNKEPNIPRIIETVTPGTNTYLLSR